MFRPILYQNLSQNSRLQAGARHGSQVQWETEQLRNCVNRLQELLLRTNSTLDAAIATRDQLISDRDGLVNKIQNLSDLIQKTNVALYGEVSSRGRTSSLLNSSVTTLTHARESLLAALEILRNSVQSDF